MRTNLPKYPTVALILIAGVGLSGCATKGFVRDQIAVVNTRIDGMDGRLRTVEGTSGQALAQAQAAAGHGVGDEVQQDGAHAVVGEALPHLHAGEISQAPRVAEELALAVAWPRC